MATPLSGVFATPDPRPSRAQGIAAALSGFGAGVQGRGPEYVMAMQEQQKALSQERQQAMIQDALAVNNLLSQNNVEGAMSLMNRRVNLINQLGGDPSDTLEVMELVQTGRVPEAQQLIGGFLGQAQAMGLYQPPQQEEFTLSPGQVRFRGSQPIAMAPESQAPGYRMLSADEVRSQGLDPSRSYQVNQATGQISAIGGGPVATTTVNLPTPTDKATEKFGEGMGERASARIEQASNAQQQNVNLMRMAEALDAGARTGLGQETLLNLQNFAQSIFGLPISETAGEQEVIRALGNRLVMEVRNPTSGLGLPGATSNRDLDFLTASVPNLARTPQGNALLIEYLMKQNQFKLDLVNEQQRIIDENNGAVPSNLDTQLMRFANNYRFLDDQFKQEVEQAIQMAQPTAQQPGQQRVGRFIIEAQ